MSRYHSPATTTATEIEPIGGPRRGAILVVEDRRDVRSGLVQLLELYGYDVFEAASGEEALLRLATADTLALVLLDLMLPGTISGREFRARQLADHHASDVPIVIVSACEPDAHSEQTLHPVAWLEKPFRPDALLTIVRQHVIPSHPRLWD